MDFYVLPHIKLKPVWDWKTFKWLSKVESSPAVALVEDDWDDRGTYETWFTALYIATDKSITELGGIKIGQLGMGMGHGRTQRSFGGNLRRPDLPKTFTALTDDFFSVGQDEAFYTKLKALPDELRLTILRSLRDIAFDEAAYQIAIREQVTKYSLLRSVSRETVLTQFRRLARGQARIVSYRFAFLYPDRAVDESPNFSVNYESLPPSNVHVVIGRNGAGKSHLLNVMARAC